VTIGKSVGRTSIEPFNPDKHDRKAFSCGVSQVDNFFKRTAHKLNRADNLRLFVMVGAADELIGFYALNAHSVDYENLPKKYARARPRYGGIPAVYISMIGVDERFSGRGYGGDLLVDALIRIARVSDEIGVSVVMLDVLDCGDAGLVHRRKALYESYGFTPLPSNPLRLFMPVKLIKTLVADGEGP